MIVSMVINLQCNLCKKLDDGSASVDAEPSSKFYNKQNYRVKKDVPIPKMRYNGTPLERPGMFH